MDKGEETSPLFEKKMNILLTETSALSVGCNLLSEIKLNYDLLPSDERYLLYSYVAKAKDNGFFGWYLFEDIHSFRAWSSIAAYLMFIDSKDQQTDSMLEVLCFALLGKNKYLIDLVLNYDYRFLDDSFLVSVYDKGESFHLHKFALLQQWTALQDYIHLLEKSYSEGRYKNAMTDSVISTPFELKMEMDFYTALLAKDQKAMQSVIDALAKLHKANQLSSNVSERDQYLFSSTSFLLNTVAIKNGFALDVSENVVPNAWLDNVDYDIQQTPWRMMIELQESYSFFEHSNINIDYSSSKEPKVLENVWIVLRLSQLLNFDSQNSDLTWTHVLENNDINPSVISSLAASLYSIDKNADVLKFVAVGIKNHWRNKVTAMSIYDNLAWSNVVCGQIWLPILGNKKSIIQSISTFPNVDEDSLPYRDRKSHQTFLEERSKVGSKVHRFWLFQLALANDFDTLKSHAEQVLESNVTKEARTEAEFFVSFLYGKTVEMTASINQMLVEYETGRRRNNDFGMSNFIAVDALVCSLVAKQNGFVIDIQSPYVPQALLEPGQPSDVSELIVHDKILGGVKKAINELKASFDVC